MIDAACIDDAGQRVWELDCSAVWNPYGDGRATELAALTVVGDPKALLKKRFLISHTDLAA